MNRRDAESWYRDKGYDLQRGWEFGNELSRLTHLTADEIEERYEAAKREFVIGILMEGDAE